MYRPLVLYFGASLGSRGHFKVFRLEDKFTVFQCLLMLKSQPVGKVPAEGTCV